MPHDYDYDYDDDYDYDYDHDYDYDYDYEWTSCWWRQGNPQQQKALIPHPSAFSPQAPGLRPQASSFMPHDYDYDYDDDYDYDYDHDSDYDYALDWGRTAVDTAVHLF